MLENVKNGGYNELNWQNRRLFFVFAVWQKQSLGRLGVFSVKTEEKVK